MGVPELEKLRCNWPAITIQDLSGDGEEEVAAAAAYHISEDKKGKKSSETEYPWPEKIPAGAEMDGALAFLNRFKPLPNKPKPFPLPFEHPLIDLENKIDEVCSFFTLILSTFQASLHCGLSTKPSILVYFLGFLHAVLRFPGLFLRNFCKAMD